MIGQDEETSSTEAPSNKLIDNFAFDEVNHRSLDDCINHSYSAECYSIHSLIRGQRSVKKVKTGHLKPIAYAQFNTTLGKTKCRRITALLDTVHLLITSWLGPFSACEPLPELRMQFPPQNASQ